eukprot:11137700-Ditylum_brightwellii.AAC.1
MEHMTLTEHRSPPLELNASFMTIQKTEEHGICMDKMHTILVQPSNTTAVTKYTSHPSTANKSETL